MNEYELMERRLENWGGCCFLAGGLTAAVFGAYFLSSDTPSPSSTLEILADTGIVVFSSIVGSLIGTSIGHYIAKTMNYFTERDIKRRRG